MATDNELPEIVNYLTDGYWQHHGEQRRKFNVKSGGTGVCQHSCRPSLRSLI